MIHGIDTAFLVAAELASHIRHDACRALLQRLHRSGDEFALAPQVLAEFVHIITDSRRCSTPLDMPTALQRAELIWHSTQVTQIFPDATATSQFLAWMQQHHLGRKRLLDTLPASTYWSARIGSVLTLNRADFDVFGCFTAVEPY